MSPPASSPQRGPTPRLSRDDIVDAAIGLGPERLTIRSVAAAAGISTAGLYRYFASREDLVTAVLARMLVTTPMPPTDRGWRTLLETEAWTRWDTLHRHPVLLDDTTGAFTGVALHRFDRLVRALGSCGFPTSDAVLALDSVLDLVVDAVAQATRLRDPSQTRTLLALTSEDVAAEMARVIADPRAHFARKLAIVLDGIAALAPSPPVSGRSP